MKIALQVYSEKIPLWVKKIETSIKKSIPNAEISYIVSEFSLSKSLNPFSFFYKILDFKLRPPNNPFEYVDKVQIQNFETQLDYLINVSFQETNKTIDTKNSIEVFIGDEFAYATPFNSLVTKFNNNIFK